MRVAVTGSAGLFGSALADAFAARHTVLRLTRRHADLTDAQALRRALQQFPAELLVHSAAARDPDRCEADPQMAAATNVEATRNVVAAARAMGAAVVYISTDAVFDGLKNSPYTESDAPAPLSVYGRTKLQAEHLVRELDRWWIFRMPVLFGPAGKDFVRSGLQALVAGREPPVASDQVACAAYTLEAAHKIREVVEASAMGLFHLSNRGACSRVDLLRRAAELAGLDPSLVQGKMMDELQRAGPRPKYAVMKMEALHERGFSLPRTWQEALADYLSTFPFTASP
ncbi:MAG TPA: NAD(P)-dependent oxidoreductase [Terriglobales bacterium]|nr:NAD(P)-dependent oxidoreductase [Terriglobales bacterium]